MSHLARGDVFNLCNKGTFGCFAVAYVPWDEVARAWLRAHNAEHHK